jgi:hypothetical protein
MSKSNPITNPWQHILVLAAIPGNKKPLAFHQAFAHTAILNEERTFA